MHDKYFLCVFVKTRELRYSSHLKHISDSFISELSLGLGIGNIAQNCSLSQYKNHVRTKGEVHAQYDSRGSEGIRGLEWVCVEKVFLR